MKINFYGDSWLWFFDLQEMKSKHMKRYEKRISFYEGALGTLNIPYSTYNVPAQSFKVTLQSVYSNFKDTDTDTIHIIFVSNIIRDTHQLESYNTQDYDCFMNDIYNDIRQEYQKLNHWAYKYKQRVLLIGGHTPVLDDHVKGLENLHVVLSDATHFLDKNNTKYDYWRFFNDVDFKQVNFDEYDPKIIDFFYNNSIKQAKYKKHSKKYFDSSDVSHPNVFGQRLILDEIFKYIEDKEWI